MRTKFMVALLLLCLSAPLSAADLVRGVRGKIAAADLQSAIAAVEDYKEQTGVDAEYLNAVGWLARGAVMLDRPDLADAYVAEVRAAIADEKEDTLTALGAAIEVQSKLLLQRDGRARALRFLNMELARAKDPSLRSRINKNINLIALEGSAAPPLTTAAGSYVGAAPRSRDGKVTLVFLWANWCGDCKAQAPVLARVAKKYRDRGLVVVAPTRLYGGTTEKPLTPAEEKAEIAKVWAESYPGLEDVTVLIDTETHVRFGASATPTFVLIDRKGVVRLYAPTRLPERELERRIEEALADGS